MKKIIITATCITVAHWILTVLVSMATWAVQVGGTEFTTMQALCKSITIPLAYAFNFPIPFLIRNNSLLIMAGNSILFAAVTVSIWILIRKIRKKNSREVPTRA